MKSFAVHLHKGMFLNAAEIDKCWWDKGVALAYHANDKV